MRSTLRGGPELAPSLRRLDNRKHHIGAIFALQITPTVCYCALTVTICRKIDRRSLLFGSFATVMGANAGATGTPRLETLTQWLNASPQERELALQPCLDRIQAMDPSIHAWVQVMPEKPTGNGKLAGIPFGAKDIIETRGLATEYGSPIYKGRIGTCRRSDCSRFAPTRRNLAGKDAVYCLRIFHARPNAQPAGFGAHAWRKLQRFGSGRRSRDGADR